MSSGISVEISIFGHQKYISPTHVHVQSRNLIGQQAAEFCIFQFGLILVYI
jgi:hypothetical protein